MENIPGNYQKALKTCTLSRPVKRRSRWTLLLVEDCGRSIQIRWYKAWIGLALFLAAVFSGTAVFCYYRYCTAAEENRHLHTLVKKTDAEKPLFGQSPQSVVQKRDEADRSRPVPSPSNAEKSRHSEDDKAGESTSFSSPASSSAEDKIHTDTVSDAAKRTSVSSARVTVEEFACSFSEQGESLSIRFHIRNAGSDAGPVSGQVFVILKPESVLEWLLLPEGKMLSGKIHEDAAGESFSISKFRSVEMTAKGQKKPDAYKSATVIVFDENRNILLEEDFPLVTEKPS